MANLIQQGSGKQEEKVIKVELPDGTAGELPIQDAASRTQMFDANNVPQYTPGYKEGGEIKKYDKGEEVRKEWVKEYEARFKIPRGKMQRPAPTRKPRKRKPKK